jgi:hypothetical protein
MVNICGMSLEKHFFESRFWCDFDPVIFSRHSAISPVRGRAWGPHERWISKRGEALMPVRIGQRCCARSIELRHLIRSQIPAYRAEIVSKLLFIPGADDNRRNRWALEQPVQCDLGHGFSCFLRDRVDRVYNAI